MSLPSQSYNLTDLTYPSGPALRVVLAPMQEVVYA